MLTKTLRFLSIVTCAMALPLAAQTPPVANQTMGTNPAASKNTTKATKTTKTEEKHETKYETKTETKTEAKAEHKTAKHTTTHHRTTSGGSHAHGYATHLAAILADTQGKATLSAASWKSTANEANALANKLYASTSGKSRTEAKEARTHVREMHKAAMKGDAEGAKSHAGMALPYVYKVIEATAPKK